MVGTCRSNWSDHDRTNGCYSSYTWGKAKKKAKQGN